MTQITQYLDIFLKIANILVLLYAFKTFLSKPHDSLANKVNTLEVKVAEIERSLLKGNDRFRDLENAREVMLHSVIALIEFEIQYCLTEHKEPSEGLKKAKEDLNSFLARK